MITDDDFVYAHSANRPQGITIAKYGKHDEKKHNSVLKMERVIMHAIVHEVTKTLSLERTLHTANEPPFTPNIPDHTHRSHSKHQAPRQYVSIGYGVRCLCSPGPGRSHVGGVVLHVPPVVFSVLDLYSSRQ